MSKEKVVQLEKLRDQIKGEVDPVISIGIGGSYLGNQVLFDLFCGPIGISLLKTREMAILSSNLQDKMWIQSAW